MNKINKRAEAMFDIVIKGECDCIADLLWNEELIYDDKDVKFAFKMLRNFVWQYRKKHNIK